MGEYEGKLSASITSKVTTLKQRNEAEAKKNAPEPETPAGADITSEAKKERRLEEPAAEGAAKAPPAPEDGAKEAKDADWQNPYGHEKGMGEYEGKLSASITSKVTTLKQRNE